MARRLPEYGLCLPVRLVRVIDGDTIVIKFREDSPYEWPIRLLDVYAPEIKDKSAQVRAMAEAAKEYAEKLLSHHLDTLSLHIPAPTSLDKILRELTTFSRITGVIYLNPDSTLNEAMVASGLASKTDPKKKKAKK